MRESWQWGRGPGTGMGGLDTGEGVVAVGRAGADTEMGRGLVVGWGFWRWDGAVSALDVVMLVLGGDPGMGRFQHRDGGSGVHKDGGRGGPSSGVGGPSTGGSPHGGQRPPRGNHCFLSIAPMEWHPSSRPPPAPQPGETAIPELPGADSGGGKGEGGRGQSVPSRPHCRRRWRRFLPEEAEPPEPKQSERDWNKHRGGRGPAAPGGTHRGASPPPTTTPHPSP